MPVSYTHLIDPSVPIGKDDSENVEIEKFGEPVVPDFEVPYHTEIMEAFDGIDLDSARRVAGNGFYYLCLLYTSAAAVVTNEHEKPLAMMSVFSLITFFIKSQMICTKRKFVYVIPAFSERPQPNRSRVYTVCS